MADIRATQSGDFSATTTWVGGVVPGSGDVAYANTFTVTISDTRTVQAISNASGTGITVGGTFSLLNGCNLTCTNANGVVQGVTSTACVTTPGLTIGNTATVTANLSNTSTINSGYNVLHNSTGSLYWIGNATGTGPGNNSGVFTVSGGGLLNITGNIAHGGPGSNSHAVLVSGGTLVLTGNVTGVNGSGGQCGVFCSGGTATINGMVVGGGNGTGARNDSGSGSLTVNGTCQAGVSAAAIGAGSISQVTRLSGPFLLSTTGNINPVTATSWRWAPTQIPTYYEVPTSGGTTKRNLYTADNIPTANYPTQGNVRSGTVYGPNLENTGTLAVPAPGSVALGVATDNTTGTAVLTSAAVQTALGAFSSGRLNNVATVDTTGAQIQAAVNT
jgi:hypothetical protein